MTEMSCQNRGGVHAAGTKRPRPPILTMARMFVAAALATCAVCCAMGCGDGDDQDTPGLSDSEQAKLALVRAVQRDQARKRRTAPQAASPLVRAGLNGKWVGEWSVIPGGGTGGRAQAISLEDPTGTVEFSARKLRKAMRSRSDSSDEDEWFGSRGVSDFQRHEASEGVLGTYTFEIGDQTSSGSLSLNVMTLPMEASLAERPDRSISGTRRSSSSGRSGSAGRGAGDSVLLQLMLGQPEATGIVKVHEGTLTFVLSKSLLTLSSFNEPGMFLFTGTRSGGSRTTMRPSRIDGLDGADADHVELLFRALLRGAWQGTTSTQAIQLVFDREDFLLQVAGQSEAGTHQPSLLEWPMRFEAKLESGRWAFGTFSLEMASFGFSPRTGRDDGRGRGRVFLGGTDLNGGWSYSVSGAGALLLNRRLRLHQLRFSNEPMSGGEFHRSLSDQDFSDFQLVCGEAVLAELALAGNNEVAATDASLLGTWDVDGEENVSVTVRDDRFSIDLDGAIFRGKYEVASSSKFTATFDSGEQISGEFGLAGNSVSIRRPRYKKNPDAESDFLYRYSRWSGEEMRQRRQDAPIVKRLPDARLTRRGSRGSSDASVVGTWQERGGLSTTLMLTGYEFKHIHQDKMGKGQVDEGVCVVDLETDPQSLIGYLGRKGIVFVTFRLDGEELALLRQTTWSRASGLDVFRTEELNTLLVKTE